MGHFSHEACFSYVRGIQNFHMDVRGWSDTAYTAIVCPHGYVFEARWLDRRTGANGTNIGNGTAYAVCYLGGEGDPFTDAGKRAIRDVVAYLKAHGHAGPEVNCHRDWKSTSCPGNDICGWVKAGLQYKNESAPVVNVPGASKPQPPTLRYGSKGIEVEKLQAFIAAALKISLAVDGDYGKYTVAAVKEFQSKNGLVVDGIAGPKVWGKIAAILDYVTALASAPKSKPAPVPKPTPAPYPAFPGIMRKGSKGSGVTQAQTRLSQRGWKIHVDGDFGNETDTIVRKFQHQKGLHVDGVIGKNTWKALWTSPIT